ncbi:MAG: peptidylprolyl isomerase, partial [Bacteroidetes bacterium]
MTLQQLALYIGVSTLLAGCAQPADKHAAPPDVVMVTEAGEIGIHLYDETPQHKAHFLSLARSGFFDSLSFHRIIPGFMIQSGDPRSRGTGHVRETGEPEDTTTLAPEFREHLVHLNGQIGAARWGDDKNPGRRSSGTQFYIVTGAPVAKTRLDSMDQACTAMRRGKF